MALQLEIVTPAQRVLTVACDEVRLPGKAGGFGVRPGHTPLLAQLVSGELSYQSGSELHRYAVGEGFCEVSQDRLRVLVEEAFRADELDAAAVQKEVEQRQKALAALAPDDPNYEMARALLERAAARAVVARR
jgi:F-type H+-transporting ATPase subunit epsilon